MLNKLNIENYEIGRQKNFDFSSFFTILLDENGEEEEEEEEDNKIELEENHHSLLYPILKYCINFLNS